jgi:sterol desaturase/sphingolipid hydroxylase (fatty acid hydroxylase superfamily)
MCVPAMPLIRLTQECLDAAAGRWPGIEPGSKRKDRPRAIRVFVNPIIENVFGKAHWVTPILWFGPLIAYGVYKGLADPRVGVAKLCGLFALGWLVWTLMEYLLHRYLFHLKGETPDEKVRAFMIHGYHHDFPDDAMRLVAPPVMSWGPAIVWSIAYWFLFGRTYFAPVLAGSAAGYVAYDWIHYYTHHARPTTALGKALRRYHMKHHFKDGDAWYGVSSPLWDYVFGTHRSKKEASEQDAHAV